MTTKDLSSYGVHTIDELIQVLQHYKKEVGGNTKINFSDFEFNGRQRQFEISLCENEKELFFFYEMHEDTWF